MVQPLSEEAREKRDTFFRLVFGNNTGYVCIANRVPNTKILTESWYEYPSELPRMLAEIDKEILHKDLYFCPHLFFGKQRIKANVDKCPSLWADLDYCSPENLLVKASVVLESSPGKYQAFWILDPDEEIDPVVAEDICRNIAYYHADAGADKSGWDLTQLLRIPLSYNFKNNVGTSAAPIVSFSSTGAVGLRLSAFETYPTAKGYEFSEKPFPKMPDRSVEDILEEFKYNLKARAMMLFGQEPEGDWSKALWALELMLFESGMSAEEAFLVAKASACNKYRRDGKSDLALWRDICKAEAFVNQKVPIDVDGHKIEHIADLLSDEDRRSIEQRPTVIEDYIDWAKGVGDAAWQYHQAGAFVVLSGLLAGRISLPTSYGRVFPNMWFMILADTTLTRKTTAMDMAVDMLIEIEPSCILATDGSIEGLMGTLAHRPGKPSVFLRDEFSGLMEALAKKDYYAGMLETLTKLYDGKFQKRVLKKEVIEVRDPVLIFFAGGIKTRVMELLHVEHVMSGFLPRFVVITAESDVARLKPLGPPDDSTMMGRDDLLERFKQIYFHYVRDELITVENRHVQLPKKWDAKLTPDAWKLYNEYESKMLDAGLKSHMSDMLVPSFDRLSKTGLKAAVLIAAATRLEDQVVVSEQDIKRAFYYVEIWRHNMYMALSEIGMSGNERLMSRIVETIRQHEDMARGTIMQRFRLTAREADQVFATLEQRGQVYRYRQGRTERFKVTT